MKNIKANIGSAPLPIPKGRDLYCVRGVRVISHESKANNKITTDVYVLEYISEKIIWNAHIEGCNLNHLLDNHPKHPVAVGFIKAIDEQEAARS